MENKVIILGSGASTGVPSITSGWGNCNPNNPKNYRRRAGIYVDVDDTKILVDTSADLRAQVLDNNIRRVDGVLYTHTHADHLCGIDDLRAFNRLMNKSIGLYAIKEHIDEIRKRFPYVLSDEKTNEITSRPKLDPNIIECEKEFRIGNLKIVPLEATGHSVKTTAFCVNEGEIVIIPDYKILPQATLKYLINKDIKLLIMPLTTPMTSDFFYHADLKTNLMYAKELRAQKVILTHMANECDYDEINKMTPDNVLPAYDNMIIDI